MTRLEELIKEIPTVASRKSSGGKGLDVASLSLILNKILLFLEKELPNTVLKVEDKSDLELSKDVLNLSRILSSLEKTIQDKDKSVKTVLPELVDQIKALKEIADSFKPPEMPEFPKNMNVTVVGGFIEKLKSLMPKIPSEMRVSNIKPVVDLLEDLHSAILSIKIPDKVSLNTGSAIKVNVPELKLPKRALEALDKLNLLGRGPGEYITVRLADEDGFYKAMGGAMGSAVALSPTPGNAVSSAGASFTLTLDGSVQRISSTSTPTKRIEFTATAPMFWGYDTSISKTADHERGCKYLPNGLAQVVNINDLNKLYFIGTSGVVVCGNYVS